MSEKTQIILASTSKAKQKLFRDAKIECKVMDPKFEEPKPNGEKPEKYAMQMALEKARRVREKVGKIDALIVALDNIGVLKKKILTKPVDEFDAKRMLREMSGQTLVALSGVAIIDALSGKEVTDVVRTDVIFREISLDEIDAYVASGEPMGAAGSIRVEGKGALLIKEMKGDFLSVVGAPISHIAEMMRENFGVNLLLRK